MTDVPMKACWSAEDVRKVITNEALEGNEGIFLATHTPITGFAITGSHATEIVERDEQGLLAALSHSERRHAFCVVQGEPGSGKSHLIRWLSVNWPEPSDLKLLLQRADGSLEGALRQLQQCLPSEFSDLFDNVGRGQRATIEGRANIFRTNLAHALSPTHFDPPLEDVAWCQEHNPTELIANFNLESWGGPARILRLLEGQSGPEHNSDRNSESASFNLFDIAELGQKSLLLLGSGVRPATERLVKRLARDAERIIQYREQGWTADEMQSEVIEVGTSLALMHALNRRRNDAVQNLIGISADGLKRLFRQVRETLARRGRRLVLLLEDITSWEGIDDSLIDVLVTNAETRAAESPSDMCPLISVVGVTPAYYQKLPGNYRARITHELNLGDPLASGLLQDVATLRQSETRVAFNARYLNAVRVGAEALNQWRSSLQSRGVTPPPNACESCPVQFGCHRVFGANDGVGLYPFSRRALENLFEALNDQDSGLTHKTPRGILQAILHPALAQPHLIEDSQFPSYHFDSKYLLPESRMLAPRLKAVLELHTQVEEQPRLSRLLAYWGDKERADTTRTADGELSFAHVRRGIFDAFRIPWLGEEEVTTNPDSAYPNPQPGHNAPIIAVPEVPPQLPDAPPRPNSSSTPLVPHLPRPVPVAPSARKKALSKSQLALQREQLRKWTESRSLEAPSSWNLILHELVASLDHRAAGLDSFTFRQILTKDRVKFEGTTAALRNYFMVKPEPWVIGGLEAFVALRLDQHSSVDDIEFNQRRLAQMMNGLHRLVINYADARLTRQLNGQRWSPIGSIIQVLLARAWLRGNTSPDALAHEQLACVLAPEAGPATDIKTRCKPWQDFLTSTDHWHNDLRNALSEMIATPQGDARSFGLASLSEVTPAILRLRDTLQFDPIPPNSAKTEVREFDQAREIIEATNGSSLIHILRTEREQIHGRVESLNTTLRSHSIRSHIARIDGLLGAVSTQLHTAAPARVSDWKRGLESVQKRLAADADRAVEEVLFDLSPDGSGFPPRKSTLLQYLVAVPSRDLEEFRTVIQLGEQTVAHVLLAVRDCVDQGRGSASLDEIQAVGHAIVDVLGAAALQTAESSDV